MATEPRPRVAPLSPQRFGLQLTMDQATHDKLCYAQALLGHSVPSGDIARVFGRALDALIGELEKTKFAATSRPRRRPRRATAARTIPAAVKRAVWERDQGQCSFVSESGQRCPARTRLEFDHLDPVARGGAATVDRVRLACRAHNQYEAECVFGTEFMQQKRQESQCAQAEARRAREACEAAAQAAVARAEERAREARVAEERRAPYDLQPSVDPSSNGPLRSAVPMNLLPRRARPGCLVPFGAVAESLDPCRW
jgi:hypothetical protein